jgi:O-succinylbenzoate synthase
MVRLPLVTPFRTSFGTETHKDAVLVHVLGPDGEGWGECVALSEPTYSAEYAAGAYDVLEHHLLPRIVGTTMAAGGVAARLAPVKGHPMAKAAVEMAVLDAALRRDGVPLSTYLGGTRDAVDAGVSVGLHPSIPELVAAVERYLAAGYRRVKLKIEPGADVELVRAVRAAIGDEELLQVDANAAYTLADADHLAALDEFGLLLIEQPLAEHDLRGSAALAAELRTPICLDESITSAAAGEEALDLGACSILNVKAGRMGGLLEARRLHDRCSGRGVPLWCGGMLETGLGRAANAALASLPGLTLPGDLSASDRYFAEDLTEPFLLVDGRLPVPTGPGLGVAPRPDLLTAWTVRSTTVR